MGISVDLYDKSDNSILCWTFDGRWDWSHLHTAIKITNQHTQARDIHIIFDVREMGLVPHNIASGLRELRDTDLTHRGKVINVVVGAEYYLSLLWKFMAPDLPSQWALHFAEDFADALAIIQNAQQSDIKDAHVAEFAQAGGSV